MDVTSETIQLEEGFRRELIDLFNQWRDSIAKIIDEGIKKGLIRKGVDSQAMATTIIGIIEGALLISQLNKKATDYKMVSDNIKRLVNGLFV
ncbi:MAG: TetR family transcriptional regulator C-terminal domain-containing protein [Nitrospirota bacterium]